MSPATTEGIMTMLRALRPTGHSRGAATGLAIAGLALAMLAGCGSSSKSTSSSSSGSAAPKASISPPPAIKSAGQILYCSEIDFPPLESYNGQTPVGADIDVGNTIAQGMGVKAQWVNVGFDALIATLEAGKCDAILSGMNDTPQRRAQISFVDYVKIGQSLIVPAGNPKHISGLASLSGETVATVTGTTQADFLKQENGKLKASGQKPISIVLFPQDTAALSALMTQKVDVDFDSATFAAVAVKKDPSVAVAGTPVNPVPDGIGVRKGNTALTTAIQRAVSHMYADGTMSRILSKWGLAGSALK